MKTTKTLMLFSVNLFFDLFFRIAGEPKLTESLKKTVKLYQGDDFYSTFTKIRLWDAPFAEIEKNVPKKGTILDLGSGDGILGNYLALSSKNRKVIGIELNKDRLKSADKGLKKTKFRYGDIVKARYPKADCILLVHVLHHLASKEDQVVVIKKAKSALNKNGKLIIVEIAEKPFLKYALTWLTDAFIVPMLFENMIYDLRFIYRKRSEWGKLLHSHKLEVKSSQAHKGMPFSHVIFIAKKA